MVQALAILFLGFLRGLEHALEADHVITVVNLSSKSRSLVKTIGVALWWGLGHALTLAFVGLIILTFRISYPRGFGLLLELLVGLTLVFVGWTSLRDCLRNKVHVHGHEHGDGGHLHFHHHRASNSHDHAHDVRAVVIGMIHGLAGTGALSLLLLSTLPSFSVALLYMVLLGLGTLAGMAFLSGLLGLPFLLTQNRFLTLHRFLRYGAGSLSIVLGFLIVSECGLVFLS